MDSTLHKPWLVSHRPGIQGLPEVRHYGLINVSPVLVNLFTGTGSTDYAPRTRSGL